MVAIPLLWNERNGNDLTGMLHGISSAGYLKLVD
jgi:hypothetical protein